MRLGLGPIELGATSARDLRALAEAAGAASFDAIWVSESRSSMIGGALAAAALVAEWTAIRVGAVVDLGLYHPLHLAEDIAVADITSRGRLEVMLRPAHDDPQVVTEHLHVIASALAGAHIQWEGLHLRIPARLADNGPVPQRLAINPPPVQPAVPVWFLADETSTAVAERLGYGLARRWHPGLTIQASGLRLPEAIICPQYVEAGALLAAAGDQGGYFIVGATTAEEVKAAGSRLVGPLRMPEFPDWVHARR